MAIFFSKHAFWVLMALLFVFLRLPSLFEPHWYGDEGIYLVLGQGINRGLTLYSQIHDNKPPLLYYLAAISQTVFGFRLLLSLVMIPTIYSFYRLSKLFFKQNLSRFLTLIFLVVTSIPFLEGNIANAEIFMLLPTLVAFILIYRPASIYSYFLSGLLLGIAFTIKIPVAFEFLFLIFWLVLDYFKFSLPLRFPGFRKFILNIVVFTAAFVLPISLWAIYFYFKQALPQFVFASLLQNFGYLSSWSVGTHSGSATQGGVMVRGLIMLAFWLLIIMARYLKKIDRPFTFLLFWFSATIFASLLSSRPYPHYLIQIIPPALLLFGWLVSKSSIYWQKIFIAVLFLLTFLIYKKFDFYSYPTISYYQNYYSYLLGNKSQDSYRNYFSGSINYLYQAADYIKNNSSRDDRIFVWGDSPFLYPLSDRLPSGRYTVAYHILDFKGYTQTMNYLKIDLPKFIVYLPMNNRPFPSLDDFIRNYYYPDAQFGKFTIFKLR